MNKRSILAIVTFLLAVSASFAQPKPKVDLAKKIADATPAELPQSPVPTSVSNDARDEGLKGKVKSVIEFNQEAGLRQRELDEESYFNEGGNLTGQVYFNEGYLSSIIVYGYVDGMRVSRIGHVRYEPGEKPEPRSFIISARAEDNTRNPSAPRDTRYSMRTVNKYDSQTRLIETSKFRNNGELWHRTTFEFENNRRIERTFDRDGQETTHTEVLDASGTAIEEYQYGGDEEPTKYVMKHQFDSKGNWIVERTYQQKTVKRKKVLELLWTTYRTITYYTS